MRTWLAVAAVGLGLAGCSEQTSNPARPSTDEQVGGGAISPAVRIGDRFIAYFGREVELDPDAVSREAPEIQFDAVEGPLSALDGRDRTIDIGVAGDWVAIHNLHYGTGGGDDGLELAWHVVRLAAGTEGLSGTLFVSGESSTNGKVDVHYDVRFEGDYDLPIMGRTRLGMSFANTGVSSAEFDGGGQ